MTKLLVPLRVRWILPPEREPGLTIHVEAGALDGTEASSSLPISSGKFGNASWRCGSAVVNIPIFLPQPYLLDFERAMYSTPIPSLASKTIWLCEFLGLERRMYPVCYHLFQIDRKKSAGVIIYQMGGERRLHLKGKRWFGTHGDKNREMDIVNTVITVWKINKPKGLISGTNSDPRRPSWVVPSTNRQQGGPIQRIPLHRLTWKNVRMIHMRNLTEDLTYRFNVIGIGLKNLIGSRKMFRVNSLTCTFSS